MISKIYRLNTRGVKRVLQKGRPFFSYGIVLNKVLNKKGYHRFGIVIGGKSVDCNVSRNFFRRRFFDTIKIIIKNEKGFNGFDFVFVVKKQMKLEKKYFKSINAFDKDLNFLINKIKLGKQKY